MKAIGFNIVVEEINEKIMSGDIIITSSVDSDVRHKKGKIVTIGDKVTEVKANDIVYYDARYSSNMRLSDGKKIVLVEERGIDPRRIVPVGKGEEDPRLVFLENGKYYASARAGGEEKKLIESYINSFKRSNPDLFKALHTMNRRTDGAVFSLDFDPATSPPADPKYLTFLPY